MLFPKKIILASNSPRRQEFLKQLQIVHEIKTFEVEEIYPEHLMAEEITNYLSLLKAKPFDHILKDDEILITSDTIVWLDNQALGKPLDIEDAIKMLQKLSGKTHQVITSFALKSNQKTEVYFEKTMVTFRELTLDEITFYINEFKPLDKAGSYGIQDWIGLVGISQISGSYTNVVGLPTSLLYEKLKSF
ncbi:MAG: Maf family nucleotide pyrophosphatase [Flavobacterium sp.]|jgi:septum formation protein